MTKTMRKNGRKQVKKAEGKKVKDPKRFFDEPLGKDGKTIRREDLQKMLQDYYVLMGWSSEGTPRNKIL